jgi:hypothetical protein
VSSCHATGPRPNDRRAGNLTLNYPPNVRTDVRVAAEARNGPADGDRGGVARSAKMR